MGRVRFRARGGAWRGRLRSGVVQWSDRNLRLFVLRGFPAAAAAGPTAMIVARLIRIEFPQTLWKIETQNLAEAARRVA